MSTQSLRRVRWAVRSTFVLGVAASVAANILHARPHPIAQIIAAWPPLALLVTVELVSHVPIHRRTLGVVRIVATAAIAAIAAFISYTHMTEVVARHGEVGAVPYLLPLSVDGLVVVASVSLVELGGRIRDTASHSDPVEAPTASIWSGAASAIPLSEPVTAMQAEAVIVASEAARGAPAAASNPVPPREAATDGTVVQPIPSDLAAAPNDSGIATSVQIDHDGDADLDEDVAGHDPIPIHGAHLAPDLVSLLPAARAARDELTRENRTVSRDSLARRLRRNGHTIRNNRVSELLVALRHEALSVNGSRPTAPA